MKTRRLLPQIFAAAAGLLLLGGLGAYWPAFVGADSPDSALSPLATIGDAITYQGYLTNENDTPLNGTFTMRFQIYNALAGGTLLWDSGNRNIVVNDGLFETRLDITTDIFNGEELWVAQTVGGELLTPRQEILPAPMAHTLRPGAIVKGTANALPNNYALEVHMNNDVFAFNRGAIRGQTTTGNAIYGLAENGRAIYGQTEEGYAVYGFDGGSDANHGYAGYFYSTNGIGVYGYSNGNRAHPNIYAPGVYGQSNQGVGVYGRGDTSNSYSFYNEGGYFEGGKGLYARGTDSAGEQGYGAHIYSNNYRGLYAQGGSGYEGGYFQGGKGLYARGTDSALQAGYGARIYSNNYHGMFVQGHNNYYDAYFAGSSGTGISTYGIVDRSGGALSLVVNLGVTVIEPGDLVAMVGITASPEGGQPMLGVAKVDASNRNAVIGVAKEAISAETVVFEDGSEYIDFAPDTGNIAPDSYLVIITGGLAPAVNVSSLALLANGAIGDKVSLSTSGEMALSTSVVDGNVVGKVAGPIDETTGTIPMFIDID